MIDMPRDPLGREILEPLSRRRSNPRENAPPEIEKKENHPLLVMVAWVVVAAPLGWGIVQTGRSSLALFHKTPPTASPTR